MISPEPFIEKCRSLAKAKKPYFDVVDGHVRLAWMDDDAANSIKFMERADAIGLGISYDIFLDALVEAGGAIDVNGRYPLNETLKQRLWKLSWMSGMWQDFDSVLNLER